MSAAIRHRGFTLVELLLGITILLVVLTAIHTSFSVGLRARTHTREQAERLRTVRTLTERIGDDFRNLLFVHPALGVDETTLVLLRHAVDRESETAVVRVRYRIERDQQAVVCTREAAPVPWRAGDNFDPLTAMGRAASRQEERVRERGEDTVTLGGFTAVRWRALRLVDGELVEERLGVPQKVDALRVELSLSGSGDGRGAQEGTDYGVTLWLPPRTMP